MVEKYVMDIKPTDARTIKRVLLFCGVLIYSIFIGPIIYRIIHGFTDIYTYLGLNYFFGFIFAMIIVFFEIIDRMNYKAFIKNVNKEIKRRNK